MRSVLPTTILASAVVALAAFTSTPAKAETGVNVPFNFTVAGQQCPAGRYIVQRDQGSNYVKLISKQTAQIFTWMIRPGSADPRDSRVILRFDDGTRALRSIQVGSLVTSKLDQSTRANEPASSERSEGR